MCLRWIVRAGSGVRRRGGRGGGRRGWKKEGDVKGGEEMDALGCAGEGRGTGSTLVPARA